MKEKIWIEKLIKYLLESKWEEYKEEYYEWYRDVELEQNIDSLSELKPFIKWLVENDKIDLDKVPNIFTTRARDRDDVIYAIRDKHDYNVLNEQYWVDLVDNVIMLVSIQDEPIRFLCEILK